MTLEGHFFTLNLLKPAGSSIPRCEKIGEKTNTKHYTLSAQRPSQPRTALREDGEGPFRPSERQQSSIRGQRHAKKESQLETGLHAHLQESPPSTHAALPTGSLAAAPLW